MTRQMAKFLIQPMVSPTTDVADAVEKIQAALLDTNRAAAIVGCFAYAMWLQNDKLDPDFIVDSVQKLSEMSALLATTGPERDTNGKSEATIQ